MDDYNLENFLRTTAITQLCMQQQELSSLNTKDIAEKYLKVEKIVSKELKNIMHEKGKKWEF